MDMMDKNVISGSKAITDEMLKCVNVGLLCVQEDPDDRPTISDVVILLSSGSTTLPTPNEPAFVMRRVTNSVAWNNELTITLEGR